MTVIECMINVRAKLRKRSSISFFATYYMIQEHRETDGPLKIEPDTITIVLLNKEPDPITIVLLNKEPDQIII